MKDALITMRNIDRDLRDAFKAACALRGETMTDTLVRFMAETVKGSDTLKMVKKGRSEELFSR